MQGRSKVLNVWGGIAVGDGDVESTTVTTRAPGVFFGTMSRGEDQLLDDGQTIPSCNMCLNSLRAMVRRSGARRWVCAQTGLGVQWFRCGESHCV